MEAVLVGENQLLYELLSSFLLYHGFIAVQTFHSVSAALDYLYYNPPPKLAILDLTHPSFVLPCDREIPIRYPLHGSFENQVTLQTVQEIKHLSPQTKIILLSDKHPPYLHHLSFQRGVNGIASKAGGLSEFLDILQRVLRGEHEVTSVRIRKELEEFRLKFSESGLSQTEIKILEMLREGMNSPQIARELGYSTKTIRNAIHKLYRKFGTSNRMEVIEIAVQIGIIS